MKTIILFIILLISFEYFGQLEKSNWIFGRKAWLKMSSAGSVPILPNVDYLALEGTSSYSDKNGNLVLYTDGLTVYNKDLEIIENGTNLYGDSSSTQTLIVPKPCSNNEFYVLTSTYSKGLRYSLVNMNLNNEKGIVTEKNIPIWSDSHSERIAAILHANETDYWIVTTGWPNKDVRAYLLTCSGIDTLNYSVGYHQVNSINNASAIGQMMPSLQGDKIAFALTLYNAYVVMDFNNATGVASNPIQLKGILATSSYQSTNYGICFSPNGEVLYTTGQDPMLSYNQIGIVQFDLTQPNQIAIEQSAQWIANTGYTGTYPKRIALQNGMDGKIYCSHSYYNSLNIIHNPNVLGLGCNYDQGGVPLYPNINIKSMEGLPYFPNKYSTCYVRSNAFCTGDTTFFDFFYPNSVASVHWNFGDTASANNTLTTLYNSVQTYHVYSQPGVYTVDATIFLNNGDTIYIQSCVTIHQNTINNYPTDTLLCFGNSITLNSGSSQQFIWRNDTLNQLIFSNPGSYSYAITNACRTDTTELVISNSDCDISIPNIFTPNQDGQNDYILFPYTSDDWMCTIYNRWGVKMITLNKDYPAWRGDENEHFNEGIYYYVYSSSLIQKSGHIYLVK